jgi:mannan endo-1,4-beta-mannosidase
VEWGYSDQKITDEISQSVKMKPAAYCGEFAHTGVGCETTINYKHIIAECQKNEIGWLAWEWDLETAIAQRWI